MTTRIEILESAGRNVAFTFERSEDVTGAAADAQTIQFKVTAWISGLPPVLSLPTGVTFTTDGITYTRPGLATLTPEQVMLYPFPLSKRALRAVFSAAIEAVVKAIAQERGTPLDLEDAFKQSFATSKVLLSLDPAFAQALAKWPADLAA